MLVDGREIDLLKIERRLLELSKLVKECALLQHEGRLFCLLRPDFAETEKAGIVNIESELRWYAVELYNMEVEEPAKIRGYKIVKGAFPKTVGGEIDRERLEELLTRRENLPEPDGSEPDCEVYGVIKAYLQSVTAERIYPSSHLELDLGLDSLDYVQLFTFIEKSFGVVIVEKEFAVLMVMRDLCDYVDGKKRRVAACSVGWPEIISEEIDYELSFSPFALSLFKALFLPLFKLYFRLSVSGSENFPKSPFIIAPSHQSMIDGFLLEAALPYGVLRKSFFLAFEGVFGTRVMRPVARYGQLIMIDVNNDLKTSMQRTAVPLKEGYNVVIFPEGARSRDRELLEFKSFFAILAKELNVPVVPVVLDGSFEALPAGTYFPRPAKIVIKYLEPVYPEDMDYREMAEKVKSAIRDEMKREPLS